MILKFKRKIAVLFLIVGALTRSVMADPKPALNICVLPLGGRAQSEVISEETRNDVSKNGRKIKIINLRKLAPEDTRDGWLETACSTNLHCDVLEVNGHHAIYPDNDTQLTDDLFWGDDVMPDLDLRALFKKTCDHSCDGLTRAPVIMKGYGCNSLACEKPVDNSGRTPKQYADALRHAHYADSQIPIVLAIKYRDYGFNSRELMQITFPNSYLEGFWDGAHFGSTYTNELRKSLNTAETTNYADFIEKLINLRSSALALKSGSSANALLRCMNDPLKCMKDVSHFDSCPGQNLDFDRRSMLEQSSELRCEIRGDKDATTGFLTNLDAIRSMVLSDRLKNYATDIHEFLMQNSEHFSKKNRGALESKYPEEASLLKILHESDPMKSRVLALVRSMEKETSKSVETVAYKELLTSDLHAIADLLDWGWPPELSGGATKKSTDDPEQKPKAAPSLRPSPKASDLLPKTPPEVDMGSSGGIIPPLPTTGEH